MAYLTFDALASRSRAFAVPSTVIFVLVVIIFAVVGQPSVVLQPSRLLSNQGGSVMVRAALLSLHAAPKALTP
jgi:uncharacterized membrane protein (DUF485 family)